MRKFILLILLLIMYVSVSAQELNAKININTQQVTTVEGNWVTSLQESLNTLLNERRWTDKKFSRKERIDCSFVITITDIPAQNSFNAEIQVASRRPVYNSSYVTSLFNFRDKKFDFTYIIGESLDFNINNISNNLIATIAYYAYVVIGLDFDSFSLEGGKPYFSKAMEIANSVQSSGYEGWEPFSGKASRYDLAVGLTDESSKSFHSMWYNYHRLGLDIMESNPNRGRLKIIESVSELNKVYEARPSSVLFTVVGDTKIKEIVNVCTEATNTEKKEVKDVLRKLFPARTGEINELE